MFQSTIRSILNSKYFDDMMDNFPSKVTTLTRILLQKLADRLSIQPTTSHQTSLRPTATS